MIARILSIKVSTSKGERIEVNEGVLLENFGLKGDMYAKPGDREVCILSVKTKERLNDKGLCTKRFIETILIDLDPSKLSVGDKIRLGNAIVEIRQMGKRCFPECLLIRKNDTCPLMTEAIFAKVIKSGTISVD